MSGTFPQEHPNSHCQERFFTCWRETTDARENPFAEESPDDAAGTFSWAAQSTQFT